MYGLGNLERNQTGETISCLAFDKAGKYLSVGDYDGRVVVFTYSETLDDKG